MNFDELCKRLRGNFWEYKGVAKLDRYTIIINENKTGTLIPDENNHVYGALIELDEEAAQKLDVVEGVKYGTYYRTPKLIEVNLINNNVKINAFAYLSKNSKPGYPRFGYLESIISAAKELNFPQEYIDHLNSLSAKDIQQNHDGTFTSSRTKVWLEGIGYPKDLYREIPEVLNFPLVWNYFTHYCLNDDVIKLKEILKNEKIDIVVYKEILDKFKERYTINGKITNTFETLNWDKAPKVETALAQEVLIGSNLDSKRVIEGIYCIIKRWRNNYYHGPKDQDQIINQNNMFELINEFLINIIVLKGLKN